VSILRQRQGTVAHRRATYSRDITTWPFSRSSIWNLPVATTATFQVLSSAQNVNLGGAQAPTVGIGCNYTSWSIPVYQASVSDPMCSVHWVDFNSVDHGTYNINIPTGAIPTNGEDGNMDVIDPDRQHVHELFYVHGTSPSFTVANYVTNDLTGSAFNTYGIRAYGGSTLGGLVREADVQAGVIRHALALALVTTQLYAYLDGQSVCRGFVWPAISQDQTACVTDVVGPYSGLNPIGTYAAIPKTVNLSSLGFATTQGLMMAHAAQDYGVYIVDRTTQADAFYAEPAVDASWIAGLASDYDQDRIHHALQVVTNNTSGTPNGGTWDSSGSNRVVALAPLP
jgi:hypothetical protein